jgi:putative membrane protein
MNSDSPLRDELARERTLLANERTFLAYVRTALGFVILGSSLIIFFDQPFPRLLAGLSFVLGAVVFGLGLVRFVRLRRRVVPR